MIHICQAIRLIQPGKVKCKRHLTKWQILLQVSNNPYMLIFGGFQVILSQIRNLDELWLVSTVVTLVSFAYSAIGLGLAVGKTTGKADFKFQVNSCHVAVLCMMK